MSDGAAINKQNNALESMNKRQAIQVRRLEEQKQKEITKIKEENDI